MGLASARQVEVPLQFDYDFIRQALLTQIYTHPGGKAVMWDDGTGCGYLTLREPTVSGAGNRVRVVTRGEARVGTPIGEQCLAPLQWSGFVEIFEDPEVSADQRQLRFHVVESNIYDNGWKKGLITGTVWDLVKKYVHPRLEDLRIDVAQPVQQIRDFLPLVVARGDAERIGQILSSIRIANAGVTDAGVRVGLSFSVSDITPGPGPTSEPTLTSDELRRWEQAWQRWDAFLTFAIKQFGRDAGLPELRHALTDVLLEARNDILEALTPPSPGAPDPTRALFLKTWDRLAPIVRRSAATQPGTTGIRYMSFIAAGDALAALDQVGPEVGLDISADGLRRLARIIAPLSSDDPLVYSEAVDPELRQLSGFGVGFPPPDLSAAPNEDAWWWRLLVTQPAWAVGEQPAPPKLERWLPTSDAIDAYLQAVRDVLSEATRQTLATAGLEERYTDLYRRLVLSTAWQESCWRQFERSRGKVTYMKSAIGSIGMMQVNEKVWRGLYDLRGLRWDIHYNARAGADILMRYLRDYAIARSPKDRPEDFLARASYAVYNGGPGHLTRFLKKDTSKTLKRIDDLFWEKFQAVSKNQQDALVRCIIGG